MADLTFSSFVQLLDSARFRSRGYLGDPPVFLFPRILVGSGETLSRSFLDRYGITHIVNCASEEACPPAIRNLMGPARYRTIDAIDGNVNIFQRWYPAFKDAMDTFLKDPTCRTVFVHCQAGVNRSVTLAVGYVSRTFGVPLSAIVNRIVSVRPCALQNPHFKRQVYDFVKKRV
jgi:hypothetical protein